ncbi:MAG: hypothetical protein IPG91_23715 [Ideonella sp.]|nr:hypothetical protein [Ideonella sp.]
MRRYGDMQIGLADASIVVLAERHATTEVLTLDLRHFQALRVGGRKRFRILPPTPDPVAPREVADGADAAGASRRRLPVN